MKTSLFYGGILVYDKNFAEKSLFNILAENEKIPFHMPGHKRNGALFPTLAKLGAEYDITEIDGFDNLHNAEGILKNSMRLASKLWGSLRSFYLVNGSTGGIISAIFSCVPFGGRVICARNCHKSVYNALKIRGAKAEFINPKYDPKTGICGEISPEDVKKACENFDGASLVIITSPTYEGVISDVGAICETAHKFNIPVLVDAAHGAHLSFGNFEKSAVHCGADIVVQSLHKTLASLTQTAILHVCSARVDTEKLYENLAIFQTSSPSYFFMASIDLLVRTLCEKKDEIFSDWQKRLDEFYQKTESLKNLEILSEKYNFGFAFDRSKIVILTHKTNISGAKLMKILRDEYSIECEMCSAKYVVAMTGMGDSNENMQKFADALLEIDKTLKSHKNSEISIYPQKFESVMTAFDTEKYINRETDFKTAENEISAEYVFAYPPGIPIIIPGERVSAEIIKIIEIYNKNGIELLGTKGGNGEKIHIIC